MTGTYPPSPESHLRAAQRSAGHSFEPEVSSECWAEKSVAGLILVSGHKSSWVFWKKKKKTTEHLKIDFLKVFFLVFLL